MEPSEILARGRTILDPLLLPRGFQFERGVADSGSGGPFARGAYVRDHWRLEFSVRVALGEVVYRVSELALSHEEFMRVAAEGDDPLYPGYSTDPVDGFRHVKHDLERFGAAFLDGPEVEFATVVERAIATQRPSGFKRLSAREHGR